MAQVKAQGNRLYGESQVYIRSYVDYTILYYTILILILYYTILYYTMLYYTILYYTNTILYYTILEGSETKKFCQRDFEILRFPGDFKIS